MSRRKLNETEAAILTHKLGSPAATRTEIAAALGLSRGHVSSLMNRDPLKTAIASAFEELLDVSRTALLVGTAAAARTLVAIAADSTASNSDRIRASRAILEIVSSQNIAPPVVESWVVEVADDGSITKRRE